MDDKERLERNVFILDLIRSELDVQLGSVDSLDTKASILIGAGAALLQLSLVLLKGHGIAYLASPAFGAAAFLGVLAIRSRTWKRLIAPDRLIKKMRDQEEAGDGSLLMVQNALIKWTPEIFGKNQKMIKRKSTYLQIGFWLIASGTGWICFWALYGRWSG